MLRYAIVSRAHTQSKCVFLVESELHDPLCMQCQTFMAQAFQNLLLVVRPVDYMAAQWEIKLNNTWKPLGNNETAFLEDLWRKRQPSGELQVGGKFTYIYDTKAMTQTNKATKKARNIRRLAPPEESTNARMDATNAMRNSNATGDGGALLLPDDRLVQVWLAGEWKKLGAAESSEISRQDAAGERKFQLKSRGVMYEIDLDHMTQTNLTSKRTRTIRFASSVSDPHIGFDDFRQAFHEREDKGKITKGTLQSKWPTAEGGEEQLVTETVKLAVEYMDLRKNGYVDLTEWNHYWAMERDSPSFVAGEEVNLKIAQALKDDAHVLGRMQMHFETACGETQSTEGLSREGLLQACKRLVASPKDVIEKKWAAEVLQTGSDLEDDDVLSYYDFLNVMLGRKRFKVSLWMYDISDGVAEKWSWLLLGHNFKGIWHTGVVVEWPERSSEFWFGGNLFESKPGTTPFGEPLEKRSIGYTYKYRKEVWDHVSRVLAHEFTSANYDVLTHNCNHFSDKLAMFLKNEHIPDEVRFQPDLVMKTLTARALRPLLNRWLGTFGDDAGRSTDSGEEARKMWEEILPGALVQFSTIEGGRPLVGKVIDVLPDDTTVRTLDFYRGQPVDHDVPHIFISKVLLAAPAGTISGHSMTPEISEKQVAVSCAWPV